MARRKKENESLESEGERDSSEGSSDGKLHITEEVRKSILYVIDEMEKLKMAKETIAESTTAIAAKMGCKPAQVKGIINLVIKEREKGGVITEEEQRLEWTREVLEQMDVSES